MGASGQYGIGATYAYDADGLRSFHHNNGGYSEPLYDLEGHIITDIPPGGRTDFYADGRHLGTYGASTYFNHPDWLGTARARSSVLGSTCETITSLPFGDAETITSSCSDWSPLHFTGQERDFETGLDHLGARYDSSQYGRFMTPDPASMGAADLTNPQSLNQYAYVGDNPTNVTDPSGMGWSFSFDLGGLGGGGGGYCNWCELPPSIPQIGGGGLPGLGGGLPGVSLPSDPSGCTYGSGSCGGMIYGFTSGDTPEPYGLDGFAIRVWVFDMLYRALKPSHNTSWPSKTTNSCSVYSSSGRSDLSAICRFFGDSAVSNSIRGCLQQVYNPNGDNGKGGYETPGVTTPGITGPVVPADKHSLSKYGPVAHAVCIPGGILHH